MKKFIKLIAVTAAIMVAVFGSKQHGAKMQAQASAQLSNTKNVSANEPQSFSIVNLLTLKCM